MSFQKQQPKIIRYFDYKKFENNRFRSDVLKCNFGYKKFENNRLRSDVLKCNFDYKKFENNRD